MSSDRDWLNKVIELLVGQQEGPELVLNPRTNEFEQHPTRTVPVQGGTVAGGLGKGAQLGVGALRGAAGRLSNLKGNTAAGLRGARDSTASGLTRAGGAIGSGARQARTVAQTVQPRTIGRAAAGVTGTGAAVGTTRAMSNAPRQAQYPGQSDPTVDGPFGDMPGRRFSPADRRARRDANNQQGTGIPIGAPGRVGQLFGGDTSYLEGQAQADPFDYADPYAEFLQSHYNTLSSAYDDQISAIAGLAPISRNLAAESQENIGGFFDYAGDVAREGIPVTEEIYDTATQNVEGIYDNLGGRLEGMPGQLTDIARDAAGGDVGSSVAGRVSAATAPFMAAGESARANATANLASHSAAGQNYLNQLAGATGGEGAMHQAHVQGALDQQLQSIAFREAELEGAKQRALAEVSSDIAGHSAERMGNAALAHALGLDLPGGGAVDPMQYLQAQGMLSDLAGGQQDPMEGLRREAEFHGLMGDIDPGYSSSRLRESATQGMTGGNIQALDFIESLSTKGAEIDESPRELGMRMLQNLEAIAEFAGNENWNPEELGGQQIPITVANPEQKQQLEQAIRRIYLNQ